MQIAIVLYHGMTALDAIGPYEVLRFMPEAQIRFVSNKPEPIVTDSAVLVLGATHSYAQTPSPDIVLVPGGTDMASAMADKELKSWLIKVHQTTRLTLSVCSGSLILGAAGILAGHNATSHWIAQKYLKQFGATSKPDDRIVRSGKIITAAGVSAGIDLALVVVKDLHGQEQAEIIQLLIEYDPMPVVDSGHPSKASARVYDAAKKQMLTEVKKNLQLSSILSLLWQNMLKKVRKT